MPDGSYSVSDVQDYIKYFIKNQKKLATVNSSYSCHVYINRINNRLMFKIKDGYKLKLLTPETMKLFDSKIKLTDKAKRGKNVRSPELVEVV